jgi:hypothetical protein
MMDDRPRKFIPLSVATPRPADRGALRAAVVQVVRHLVVASVPEPERSPWFDTGRGLLEEAGWGLDELYAASSPGPARDRLFAVLDLAGDEP